MTIGAKVCVCVYKNFDVRNAVIRLLPDSIYLYIVEIESFLKKLSFTVYRRPLKI